MSTGYLSSISNPNEIRLDISGDKRTVRKEPLFFFGIAQKPRGLEPFESYFFLFNIGESPILNITVIKKGEFYYLVNQMKIASELRVDEAPWWGVNEVGPNERKMKKMKGIEARHLPDKETVLAKLGLPAGEPMRFILWLEIAYTEAGERKKEPLFCALEPDGINLLPILTSEDPYQVISKRLKELV